MERETERERESKERVWDRKLWVKANNGIDGIWTRQCYVHCVWVNVCNAPFKWKANRFFIAIIISSVRRLCDFFSLSFWCFLLLFFRSVRRSFCRSFVWTVLLNLGVQQHNTTIHILFKFDSVVGYSYCCCCCCSSCIFWSPFSLLLPSFNAWHTTIARIVCVCVCGREPTSGRIKAICVRFQYGSRKNKIKIMEMKWKIKFYLTQATCGTFERNFQPENGNHELFYVHNH